MSIEWKEEDGRRVGYQDGRPVLAYWPGQPAELVKQQDYLADAGRPGDAWLREVMRTLFGEGEVLIYFDIARGALGCFVIVLTSGESRAISCTLSVGDPIVVLDAFRCACCGLPYATEDAREVHTFGSLGARTVEESFNAPRRVRQVCKKCVGDILEHQELARRVFLRDAALGLDKPEWQPGGHGVPLERAEASS